MINLNRIIKTPREKIEKTYEQLVAVRLEQKWWRVPDKLPLTDNIADKIRQLAKECCTNEDDFIVAQFVQMSKKFCRKHFNLEYPPLNALIGRGAALRYWHWWEQRKVETGLKLMDRIASDIVMSEKVFSDRSFDQATVSLLTRGFVISPFFYAFQVAEGESEFSEVDNYLRTFGGPSFHREFIKAVEMLKTPKLRVSVRRIVTIKRKEYGINSK